MNIHPITPSFTGSNVVYRVSKDFTENAARPFFTNEVLNVVREQKLPANIKGNTFDITFDSHFQQEQMKKFENTLNEAGIKFKLLI